jgi:hypothetical protein
MVGSIGPLAVVAHPSEDGLESYVMGKMPVADRAHLQFHIQLCAPCRDALVETSRYVEAIITALHNRDVGDANKQRVSISQEGTASIRHRQERIRWC